MRSCMSLPASTSVEVPRSITMISGTKYFEMLAKVLRERGTENVSWE